MAIYAVVDERGQVLSETVYDPPLTPKEIEKGRLPNGKPSMLPLILVQTPFDEASEKVHGFTYQVETNAVNKIRRIVPLTADEKKHRQVRAVIETRRAALPEREETFEILAQTLVEVIEALAMHENAKDPSTKLTDSLRAKHTTLKNLVALCEANPVPK